MIKKTIYALIIIACMIPPTYMGGMWLQILLGLIAFAVAYEINSLLQEPVNYFQIAFTTVAIMAIEYAPNNAVFGYIIAWVMLLFVIDIVSNDANAHFIAYTFLISMIVSIAMRTVHNLYLMNGAHNGFYVLLYVCLACYLCDTGAYFFGSFYGKRKLAPNISPNKTWEGAIGGYILGAVGSLIYGLLVLDYLPKSMIIAASLVLPIFAQYGDLSFSLIKRKFEKKDFGSFLPVHGGVLDRVDSLIFALIAFQAMMVMWGL